MTDSISKSRLLILKFLMFAGFVFFTLAAQAAPRSKPPPKISEAEVPSSVQTDEKSFAQIFEANLVESKTKIAEGRKLYDMEFAYVANSLSSSSITNDYYVLNFGGEGSTPSMLRFYASYEVYNADNFFISPSVGLGYSFQESILSALSKKGGTYKDVVKIQWAPLLVGSKFGYRIPRLKSSTVFARLAATYDWISISGNLDGIGQSYWTPNLSAGLGATFFETDKADLSAWFGGVSISAGASRPLSDDSRGFSSNWVELGLRILL